MEFKNFESAKKQLEKTGFNFISGNILFSTFKNTIGKTAYLWANGVNVKSTYTVELN